MQNRQTESQKHQFRCTDSLWLSYPQDAKPQPKSCSRKQSKTLLQLTNNRLRFKFKQIHWRTFVFCLLIIYEYPHGTFKCKMYAFGCRLESGNTFFSVHPASYFFTLYHKWYPLRACVAIKFKVHKSVVSTTIPPSFTISFYQHPLHRNIQIPPSIRRKIQTITTVSRLLG